METCRSVACLDSELSGICMLPALFLWSDANGTPWLTQRVDIRKPYLTLNARVNITVAGLASAALYTSRDPLLGPIEFKSSALTAGAGSL